MQADVQRIINETEKAIIGKRNVVIKVLMAVLAQGHILLDDVPGTGKTTLAVALTRSIGLDYGRVQFTPDVLPSDIVGFTMFNPATQQFEYSPGIVTGVNLLLCDEINRTSAKTQSALLEAMQERQVTVDGTTHPLKQPFSVIATQNNVGSVGTQLLPQAQLDRFLIRLTVGYPARDAQMSIIRDRQVSDPLQDVEKAVTRSDLLRMQDEVRAVQMADSIIGYVADLTEATQTSPLLDLGISPRRALAISSMARSHAYVDGRDYTIPEDVIEVFCDVCAHRVLLSQRARAAHKSPQEVLEHIRKTVNVPDALH